MSSKRLSLGSHFLSTKKKGDLTELFSSFDKDNNGRISYSELQDMLQSAGINSAAIPSMLKDAHADLDKDGCLAYEDFARLMRPTLSDPHRSTSKQQELKEAFEAFDKDGDGFINVAELQAMMEKLGDKLTLAEAQQLIGEVDLDKDGVVNLHEFMMMMTGSNSTQQHNQEECTHHHHKLSVRRLFCSHK